MAAVKAPFGFKPCRSLNGNFNPATRRFAVLSTGVQPMFIGDPVCITSSNVVRTVTRSVAVTAVVGVVAQLLDSNQKPLVFSQPTRGPFLPLGTAGFADVYIDTDNVYYAATDVTAGPTFLFNYCAVTAQASSGQNNAVGRSPLVLSLTGTGVTAVGSTEYPFQIIGAYQRDSLVNTDWTDGVEVVIRPSRDLIN